MLRCLDDRWAILARLALLQAILEARNQIVESAEEILRGIKVRWVFQRA